jgi:tellurite resistance protein
MLRRFVSDELYQKLEEQIKNEAPFVYNRIYLNDVTVTGANKDGNKYSIKVAVKMSFQRVDISSGKLIKLDYAVMSDTWMVNMLYESDDKASKGSLYAHTCPNCGGTLGDTIDIKCQWCGSVLNAVKGEWIISSLIEPGYMTFNAGMADAIETDQGGFGVLANAEKLDDLLDVRDFAFNNVAVMIAIDGKITDEESALLRSLSKKWGYNVNKIEPMISLAINNRLPIRMPDNPKKREKIIKLMEKAAQVDGNVSEEEQQLLDRMRKDYLN